MNLRFASFTMRPVGVSLIFLLSIITLLSYPSHVKSGGQRETLKSVQILFRHGDRTPDIGDMIGVGRLTEKGKREAYDLGLFLRERYDNFLPLDYNPDDISLISSDSDRTIQSASLAAYGIYRTFNLEATWADPDQVFYEPIPVRHVPKDQDKYFQVSKKCPRWEGILVESVGNFTNNYILDNPDIVELYTSRKDNISLFDPQRSMLTRLDPLIAFQDEILYNITHGLAVEDWCYELIKIRNYYGIKTSYYRAHVNTREKQRLYSGPLLKMIFDNFDRTKQEKMSLSCLHDKTLFTFMETLGIYDKDVLLLPPTTAALMIELHENITSVDGPYLEFWYRNETSLESHYLSIPGCGNPCLFATIKQMKRDIIPVDYEAECLITPVPINGNSQGTWLLLWGGAAAIVLIFGFVILSTRSRPRRYEKI